MGAVDVVELLQQALLIPSPSGSEQRVADYLVSRMSEFAHTSFVDEAGNAVCLLGQGPRKITFLGHIDTVPGVVPVRLEGGRLFGRGAVDAKGPFCAALAAAAGLDDEVLSGITLTLIGATEEEAPSSRGARHAARAYPPPDLLIIGEPSGWDAMTLGYKGRLVVTVEVSKDNHHSAGQETTAAQEAVAVWNLVSAWAARFNDGRERVFEQVQASLQEIRSAGDGLRQECVAVIGLRLPPALAPELATHELLRMLPEKGVVLSGAEQPYQGPRDTPLTRAFRWAIRDQAGKPRFLLKTGTSDMNVVAPHWPVPMLAYGPGDSTLDHTPHEHVEIADLRRATAVLGGVFSRLAVEATRPNGPSAQSPDSS